MANLKDLIVNGASRFIGKVYINDSSIGVINNSTVGNNPKFTDTNTTYTISMSNNVITLTGSNGNNSTVTLPVYNGGVST